PPSTRRKRVRAARMRYRDSTVVLTNLHTGPRGSRRVAFATLLTTRIEVSPHPEERLPISGLPEIGALARKSGKPDLRGASRRMRPALLSQPFEQRRNVDLIGLVVAGERVHHDVDAGAEREFALARLGGDEREHGLAVLAHRPGAGEIVRRDDDRRYAVAGARRTACRLVLVDGRQRFHPQLAGGEAAGKVLQEIERLGQHVVAP